MLKELYKLTEKKVKTPRSPKWPALQRDHLSRFPNCAACGRTAKVVVHHMIPVHVDPTKELDPTNLLTLCEWPSLNCHLCFGYLGDFRSWNVNVVQDAQTHLGEVQKRPYVAYPNVGPDSIRPNSPSSDRGKPSKTYYWDWWDHGPTFSS